MQLTLEKAKELMAHDNGDLDLTHRSFTRLPDGLKVEGSLYLFETDIDALPEDLTVGLDLDLYGTAIDRLPDGLKVGRDLDLRDTRITSLPDGLTVGGSIRTASDDIVDNPNTLRGGDYLEGKYLYADGILTHVKKKKTLDGYTFYVGKIPGKNVVYDGTHYSHCRTLREGIADLVYKSAKDHGADQYRNVSFDTAMPVNELVAMYRVITGACHQGSQTFVDGLGDDLKESYTIREAIRLTKSQYGSEKFARFFGAA